MEIIEMMTSRFFAMELFIKLVEKIELLGFVRLLERWKR